MKKLTICWIIIIVMLSLSLIFVGYTITKKKAPYKALENDMVEAAQTYYGQDTNLNKLPKNKGTSKVTIGELESFGINVNNIISGDTCDGFVIVKAKDVAFSYKAYIKCNEYKTKDYEKFEK